ncbi:uncharacterized protein O3C94_017982 [Discoglossus pictus]
MFPSHTAQQICIKEKDAELVEMDTLEETSFRSEPGSSDCSLNEGLTLSPDLGLSPVTCMCVSMGHMNCANRSSNITPRRRLKLSPDSQNTSPTDLNCQLPASMEKAPCTGFPNESTPKMKEKKLGKETSDSSFDSIISKPRKLTRRAKLRDNEENAALAGAKKKKSRMKLSELFQSPEHVKGQQKQWSEKVKVAQSTEKKQTKSTADGGAAKFEKLSVNDVSPKVPVADCGSTDLIGDFSQPYCLPVEKGKHEDLKYINCNTLAALMSGGYKDVVKKFQVVDCRYPYEYAGGHIKGSWNLFREEHIRDVLIMHAPPPEKKLIVIFHCEFSSKRGPKMCRTLRNMDRNINKYPNLHYPELYLLKGGYKEFYEKHKNLCEPKAYVDMLHSDYREQYKKYHRMEVAARKIRKELFMNPSPKKSTKAVTSPKLLKDVVEN